MTVKTSGLYYFTSKFIVNCGENVCQSMLKILLIIILYWNMKIQFISINLDFFHLPIKIIGKPYIE